MTYPEVGATADAHLPDGYHHLRVSRAIGRGRRVFERAADELLDGAVQRRAGIRLTLSETPLRQGTQVRMRIGLGPFAVAAPCLVVWAERTDDRCGFAYGTLRGHPETGEERFELRLGATGDVTFTITAFSRPARWFTRLFPVLGRSVQLRMTGRYVRALDTVQPIAR